MTVFDEQEVQEIIARVRSRLGGSGGTMPDQPRVPADIPDAELGEGLFGSIDEAVEKAKEMQ